MPDQPTPISPTASSIATSTFPSQARTPSFPLTRKAKARQQILGMVLYALFLALCIATITLLTYFNVSYVNGSYETSYPSGVITGVLFWLYSSC